MERSLLTAVLEFAGVVRRYREDDMSAEKGAMPSGPMTSPPPESTASTTFSTAGSPPTGCICRGRAGLGQDHPRAPVPAGRRAARRAGALRHAVGDRGRAPGGRRIARLVARGHHDPRAGAVRGEPGAGRAVHDVPPVRGRARARPPSRSWRTSSGSSRRASCSTRCPSCACWPAIRCATAGRSWR